MEEKEKYITDFLKKVSPGTQLRTVIDDLVGSNLGALIVFYKPELQEYIEGGFRVNCRFTPQRLFELCKMDGAIVVSSDLKRILYANVLLIPDAKISTEETGTRHKAAERIAKQTNTLVIAVSERRKKTTLYASTTRYNLRASSEILRKIESGLQILEKQREIFDNFLSQLNILEISNMASASDVVKTLQKAEMSLRISESLKKEFIEIGKEGEVLNLRHKEVIKGVEKRQIDLIRDYSKHSLKKTKTLMSGLTFDNLTDVESFSNLILEEEAEEAISPKGYRFLSLLELDDKEIQEVVKQFNELPKILELKQEDLEPILKSKSNQVFEDISSTREQVLEGKITF